MSVNLNFLVKRGGQLVESSILKPTQNFNLQGVKYVRKSITNIAVDGFPIHLHDNLDEIATLRNSGVTLAEIANRFGVNRNVIQKFLNKFAPDAVPENRRFLSAVRIFFLRQLIRFYKKLQKNCTNLIKIYHMKIFCRIFD